MRGESGVRIGALFAFSAAGALITGCALLSGENDLHEKARDGGSSGGALSSSGGNGGASGGGTSGVGGAVSGGSSGTSTGAAGATGATGGILGTGATDGSSPGLPDASTGGGGTGVHDAGPPECAPGTIDCGTAGCLENDVHDCGTCGHDCTQLLNVNGDVTCGADGVCHYDATSCAPGNGICSSNPDDGCAPIDTKDRCGTCTTSCGGGTPVCAQSDDAGTTFACSSGCKNGQSLCSGSCVDESSDPKHCGSCSKVCPTDPSGLATCTNGTTCGLQCNSGSHLCGGKCVSNADPKNCGTKCGTNCPAPTTGGGSASCNASACALSCPAGETSCNGACIDVNGSDANNCGGCGTKCTGGNVCQGGSCVCPSGTQNCGGTCVNLTTSNGNCGACGKTCGSGQTCQGSTCVCTGGTTNCSGACVNLASDRGNCGACGHTCYSGQCDGSGNCLPWTVVDTPNTSTPAALVTDGTAVVWLDTGLTSIKQANYDGTNVLTLSKDTAAFANALQPYDQIMSLGGGVVVVASETMGLYKAVVNSPSTVSMPLGYTIPAQSFVLWVAVNTGGTQVGFAASNPNTNATQLIGCPLSSTTCTPFGTFSAPIEGAAANGANYYFSNPNGAVVEYYKFGTTTPNTIVSSVSPGYLVLDSSNAYFFNGNFSSIDSVPLVGGTAKVIVSTLPANTGDSAVLATDGRNVYYTAFGNPAYLGYAPVGGFSDKSAKVIATVSSASSVAAAGGKVFWIDGTTIYGIAAP